MRAVAPSSDGADSGAGGGAAVGGSDVGERHYAVLVRRSSSRKIDVIGMLSCQLISDPPSAVFLTMVSVQQCNANPATPSKKRWSGCSSGLSGIAMSYSCAVARHRT